MMLFNPKKRHLARRVFIHMIIYRAEVTNMCVCVCVCAKYTIYILYISRIFHGYLLKIWFASMHYNEFIGVKITEVERNRTNVEKREEQLGWARVWTTLEKRNWRATRHSPLRQGGGSPYHNLRRRRGGVRRWRSLNDEGSAGGWRCSAATTNGGHDATTSKKSPSTDRTRVSCAPIFNPRATTPDSFIFTQPPHEATTLHLYPHHTVAPQHIAIVMAYGTCNWKDRRALVNKKKKNNTKIILSKFKCDRYWIRK